MNNVPTALIFFARPDLLRITFEEIRKAKPTKLFLIQDGARKGNVNDINKILECQRIVENIDWECEVYRNYASENLGCGMRVYSGISWAFQYTDRLLILEDDCVPSQSLFPFVEELLERYKDDARIGMISGMNNFGIYKESPKDYFFTTSGSIWGWATWKRVWDHVDFNMNFLEDTYSTAIVFNTDSKLEKMAISLSYSLKQGKKLSSWSFQLGMSILLNNQLNIVPKFNMISNIGMAEDGANSVSSLKFMPKGLRRIFFMKTYNYQFPLQHPQYIVNDLFFKKKLDRIMGDGYPLVQKYRMLESIFYRLIGGDFKSLKKGISRRINK